jgi:hypothetical protein
MILSDWFLFRGRLKGGHRVGPHLVKVGAQPGDSLGIQPVESASSGFAVGDEPGILEHTQVLRYRWAAHRQGASQLVYGRRAARELLKDGHAGGITQSVEAGL